MTLRRLPSGTIRARRRPRAIALLWLWELALALVLGTSFASLARETYGRHPDGDTPLFAPGGLALLDFLRHSLPARGPLLCEVLAVLAAAHLLGLVPSAAVFAELAFETPTRKAPPPRDAIGHAIAALPASFALSMVGLALQGVVVVLGGFFAGSVSTSFGFSLRTRDGNLIAAAIALASVAVALVVGVAVDLARAEVVRHETSAVEAAQKGLERFLLRPVAVTWSYTWRSASSWVPVGLGALLATRIGGRGGASLLVLAAFHQVVVLVRVAIRASWMARALRALGD